MHPSKTPLALIYTPEHIEKIGNTIVFLVSKMEKVSKTKLLKLIYILDELSIKRSGIPFLNLEYKVWKFGPVANDIYVELSSPPSLLKDYIGKRFENGKGYIEAKKPFNDDEFSKNELELMEFVVEKFRNSSKEDLISFTHRQNSPWHSAAVKHSVLDLLEKEQISSTDIKINMMELIDHDERKKSLYLEYLITNIFHTI